MRVILASGSPRRRDLLSREGVSFQIRTADVDETLDSYLSSRPHEAARYLAGKKAEAVARLVIEEAEKDPVLASQLEETAVIGSDTMVVLGERIFGKPLDAEDAASMLKALSGRTHEVISGVSVWSIGKDESGKVVAASDSFDETSYVTFKSLSEQDIQEYLACGESFDKAGAYAIQGEGSRLVGRIEGDYDNIVGLPVARLLEQHPELKAE